jgi:hypothetical protein
MKLPGLSQEILKSKSLVFSCSISMVADRLLTLKNPQEILVKSNCFYLHKALVADRQIDLRRVLGKNSWWPTDRLIYEGTD